MRYSEPQYDILQAALLLPHPETGAFDADDELAADQFKVKNRTLDRKTVTSKEILDAILNNPGEWTALTDSNRDLVRMILDLYSDSGIPTVVGSPARTQLIAILGTATKAEIAILIVNVISFAEELGIPPPDEGNVTNARARPPL